MLLPKLRDATSFVAERLLSNFWRDEVASARRWTRARGEPVAKLHDGHIYHRDQRQERCRCQGWEVFPESRYVRLTIAQLRGKDGIHQPAWPGCF